MKRLALALALFFAATTPARAGFDEGIAAVGRGDFATAYHEFQPLAQAGDAAAQFYLGLMYQLGLGAARDDAQALKWLRLAAEQELALAQMTLGHMYANGQGVAKNHAEAVKWYRLAAEQGDAFAQFNLGLI
jgi:TPR repeat protein